MFFAYDYFLILCILDMKKFHLLISPCPNDTYIFYALIHQKIDTLGIEFIPHFWDIKELNQKAKNFEGDLIKVSYYVYLELKNSYYLLGSGGALGRGCGPLLVTQKGKKIDNQSVIAIPGIDTTAHFLLQFYNPYFRKKKVYLFHEIMPRVSNGEVDAGVIIHESRFTYPEYGLECIEDLGNYWELKTGLPIPLGGIIMPKSKFTQKEAQLIEELIKKSILYAQCHEEEVLTYCQYYAQEMSKDVMLSHIRLYVNEFSLELGQEGQKAIQKMEEIIQSMH